MDAIIQARLLLMLFEDNKVTDCMFYTLVLIRYQNTILSPNITLAFYIEVKTFLKISEYSNISDFMLYFSVMVRYQYFAAVFDMLPFKLTEHIEVTEFMIYLPWSDRTVLPPE